MVIWKLLSTESFMQFYMQYFFVAIRKLSRLFLHWVPFPVIYLILPVMVSFLLLLIVRLIKLRTWKELKYLAAYIFGLYMLFFVSWGFIYNNQTISQQFNLELQEVNEESIFTRLESETFVLDSLNNMFHINSNYLSPSELEDTVRLAINHFLQDLNLQTFPMVKIREVQSGLLLRLETSGIYFPYAFEGHYDKGLHPIQKPFTAAHEMLHGYGYGQESDCNFFAYLACNRSNSIALKYSAQMAYWRYLASNCRRLNKERYTTFYATVSKEIKDDLLAIRDKQRIYKPLLGPFRDLFYDWYLKSNGVQDGLKNYSAFINMVESWREKYPEK